MLHLAGNRWMEFLRTTTNGRFLLLRDSFRVGLPYPYVCRKRVVVHKADPEMNKLTCCKRLKLNYVSESDGVFAAIFPAYNADSSLRIESLYDSSHVAPAFCDSAFPIPADTSSNGMLEAMTGPRSQKAASLNYSRFCWRKKKRCSKRLMNTGF